MHNIEIVNFISKIKSLPLTSQKSLGIGFVLAMIVTLPLLIWAIVTQTFNTYKKASDTAPIVIDVADAPYIGSVDAPITVVEFADFQCPYCKTFHDQTLSNLLDAYPGQIRFVFKNFPLTSIHPEALSSANAAMCANEQGKFWEMHDVLFTNQDRLGITDLKTYAAGLGLDTVQFDECLDQSRYSDVITNDVTDGTTYGVNATPTFFINGIRLTGAQPLSAFQEVIDSLFNPSPTPSPTVTPDDCTASANTITVTPTGTDGPCHDIQTAIDNVTGSGFTILIKPGEYNLTGTVRISGKNQLTLTGDSTQGNGATVINFVPNGWGFLIENSSGSIEWLTVKGGSSNGMVSIKNSHNFEIGYTKLSSNSSHTLDVQNSSEISIFNSDIQSSAGAVEIELSNNVNLDNNVIHDSANGVSVINSGYITLLGNLITANTESGIRLRNVTNTGLYNNTVIDNNLQSGNSAIQLSGDDITLLRLTNNLVINNHQAGISFDGINFTRTVDHNDVWNNASGNYIGLSDYTGVNGNISLDPLVNFSDGLGLCLNTGSPALYGNPNNREYMGYIGPCGILPTPSPLPVPGDANGDGHVNIVDIGIVIDNYRARPLLNPKADLNGDGIVNIVDIGIIIDNYEF